MEKQQLAVTAAIIEDKGKYLITQRSLDKHNGGRWEFPGGKVEFGEDLRKCLEREINEELRIKVKALDTFEYSSAVYNETRHVILYSFLCKYISGDIKKLEIMDFKWVIPKEMKNYDITEADHPMVDKLIKLYEN